MNKSEETWVRFSDHNEVSSLGNIRSIPHIQYRSFRNRPNSKYRVTGRMCRMTTKDNGYLSVKIDGKRLHVHRIVAQAFTPNPDNKPDINHKNGIKTDNNPENLEWVTKSENMTHKCRVLGLGRGSSHSMSKITETDALDIRSVYAFGGTQRKIAASYGITQSTVSNIITRHTWAHLP